MKRTNSLLAILTLIISGMASAVPGVTVGAVSDVKGATVAVPVAYLGTSLGLPNGVVAFQATFNFDNAKVALTATGLNACNAVANITCSSTASSVTILGTTNPVAEIASANFDIGFSIFNTAAVSAGDVIALDILAGPPSIINPKGEEYTTGGGGTTPANGTVNGSITVNAVPAPVFSSTPADTVALTTINNVLNFGTATTSIDITNTGNADSLDGSCSITTNPSSAFSFVGGTNTFSLVQMATSTLSLACDNTLPVAAYNGVLTCTSNGGAATTYPLVCNVTAPGPAVYGSAPAAAATTNLTGMTPLLGGSAQTVVGQDLVISNTAGAGNNDLEIISCVAAGAPEVTVTNPIAANTMIAPGADAPAVTFACDVSAAAAAVATFNKTYTCTHAVDGASTPVAPTSVYTYTCGTRAAASAGSPANSTMSAANITAPPGGSTASTVLNISETLGEGADLTMVSCSLATGTDFALTAVPVTVASGTSLGIEVTFTDPAAAGPYTDVLTCTYTDSAGAASVTVALTGFVQALVIPALSTIGYVAMMFGLLLVGFFGFRRRA